MQLQKLHAGRLNIVQMELLQPDTIKVKARCIQRAGLDALYVLTGVHTCQQAAADKVLQSCPDGVDYLINNAGILGTYSTIQEQ